MSKKASEAAIFLAYSNGYMTGLCGKDDSAQPSVSGFLSTVRVKGYNKGLEIRKLHQEKLRRKPWFTLPSE